MKNASITSAIKRGAETAGRAAWDHREEIAEAAEVFGAAEGAGPLGWLRANRRHVVMALVAVVVIVAIVLVARAVGARRSVGHDLAAAGWTLYTSDDCGYCRQQLEILGMLRYPKQVKCTDDSCPSVYAFPTWEAPDGRRVLGVQSEETLKAMAKRVPHERHV